MIRRAFTIASTLSLILCIGTLVLWVSMWGSVVTPFHHTGQRWYVEGQVGRGAFSLYIQPVPHESDIGTPLIQWEGFGCGVWWYRTHGRHQGAVSTTLLYPAALFGVLPLVRRWRTWRREQRWSRRRKRGRCTVCGYDLRASSGRCPECGAEMPAKDQ